jgi:choline-sulfatase
VYVPQAAKRHLRGLPAGAPWFCCVSFGGPHPPYDTPEPYASLYRPERIPPPESRMHNADEVRGLLGELFRSRKGNLDLSLAEILALKGNYAGAITLIDEQIGELLSAVEARGEVDNTLIIFTSDHGEMDGDQGLFGKNNPLDPAAKVPLIVLPPGRTMEAGSASTAFVELMDVGATIADYAGAKLPGLSNARSLRAVLDGKSKVHRAFAVSEFDEHYVLVTPKWKTEFNDRLRPMLLLDRQNDPDEQHDLSQEPGVRAVLGELTDLLKSFLEQTPPQDGVFSKKRRKQRRE